MTLRSLSMRIAIPVVACALVSAQGPPQDQPDPPSRVARLNYINGSVSFRPGSVEEWTAATLNYPLTTGDHLWTDRESGAEIHIGAGVLHLADQTAFAILNLDDRTAQLSVTQGAVNVNLPRLGPDESFEVDTPNGAIVLLRSGDYRIDVNGDANSTALVVRAGDAEVTGSGQAMPVHARQMLRFAGTDQLTTEALAAPAPDEFDRWCMDRDQNEARAIRASERYVPPDMIGAGDLAGNGVWRTDPVYGPVWVPMRTPVGWAPYRFGHWAYVMPWGWTWIDDMPWGFAPFHYGRWAMAGGGWVWVPGAMVARPVYAPALVAFVGGGGFSMAVGVGGGGVAAWIPLGPREVYRPYYHVSDAYVRNVNVTHVTNINVTNVNVTNVNYVNRTYVTAVPQGTFTGARPVATAAVRVPPEAIGRAQAVNAMDVRPVRESYMGHPSGPGQRFGTPPARAMERPVVVKQAPPESARPMGGVRMANQPAVAPNRPAVAPIRPAQPQMDVTRPQRNDRPANIYNGRPQPANNPPSNPAPQVERAPQREYRPPQPTNPAPQVQQSQPPQERPHGQPPSRDQRRNNSDRKKEEKKQ